MADRCDGCSRPYLIWMWQRPATTIFRDSEVFLETTKKYRDTSNYKHSCTQQSYFYIVAFLILDIISVILLLILIVVKL